MTVLMLLNMLGDPSNLLLIYGLFKLHKSLALGHLYPQTRMYIGLVGQACRMRHKDLVSKFAGAILNQVHPKSQQLAPSRMLGRQ